MIAKVIFVFLLLVGSYLVVQGAIQMYTKEQKRNKDKENELNAILSQEVLRDKAKVKEISYDELLDYQFQLKPSEIFANMFEQDPFRIGL